jgi:uncharacterized membrane protein (DUF4010 family)
LATTSVMFPARAGSVNTESFILSSTTAFERILVAVFIGVLIGLDRERAEVRKTHQLFAGIRTFPLIALAGAIPMLVIDVTGPALLIASFFAVAGVVIVSYLRTSTTGDIGATTEVAAFATFLLGVLAGAGHLVVAGATGVGVAVLLVAKPRLESFSRALTNEELTAALELAVISVIVLPLLPNQGYGPWEVLNPLAIWSVVVLVCALSFIGFIAMRLIGERRGLAIAGIVGALVSSTAVTVAMATRSRANKGLAPAAAAATVLASTIMCLRAAVLGSIINLELLPRLLPVVVGMVATGAVSAWFVGRNGGSISGESSDANISNPFSLAEALSFGGIYALVLLGVRAAQEYFGAKGVYLATALSAIANIDAVTIASAQVGAKTGWTPAAAAVTVAMVTNTLVKLGIAVTMGASGFRQSVALALGLMAVVGTVVGGMMFW